MKKYYWWAALAGYVIVVLSLARIVTDKTDCALNYLPCLEANGLGDFLAGAFAPLAFVWLARAVYMQSSQLEMQKEELRLTREEMVLARQVAEETKKEIKAQADAMVLQKDILQAQLDAERQVRADAEFKALETAVFELFSLVQGGTIVSGFDTEYLNSEGKPSKLSWMPQRTMNRRLSLEGFVFQVIFDELQYYDSDKFLQNILEVRNFINLSVEEKTYRRFVDIKMYLEQIAVITPFVSPSTQSYITLSRFEGLNDKVKNIVEFADGIMKYLSETEPQVEDDKGNS